jgi:hypothetical protein
VSLVDNRPAQRVELVEKRLFDVEVFRHDRPNRFSAPLPVAFVFASIVAAVRRQFGRMLLESSLGFPRFGRYVSRYALSFWNPDAAGEEIVHQALLLRTEFRHNRLRSANDLIRASDSIGNHLLLTLCNGYGESDSHEIAKV